MADELDYIMLSALQHYSFCPRQCGLIHIEQAWTENFLTAQGRVLHERVDSGISESRKGIRTERGVYVVSHKLGIRGRLDLLEIIKDKNGQSSAFRPIEYKRGKVKIENHDRIQLCAQVLCVEEMHGVTIKSAAIWYWEERKRENVEISQDLRNETLELITKVNQMIRSGLTPRGVLDKKCKSCSLFDQCGISYLDREGSAEYVKGIFKV